MGIFKNSPMIIFTNYAIEKLLNRNDLAAAQCVKNIQRFGSACCTTHSKAVTTESLRLWTGLRRLIMRTDEFAAAPGEYLTREI